MKRCTQCGETKPLDEFYRRKAECKRCSIARTQRWYAAHPERRKRPYDPERGRKSHARQKDDPEFKARARERARLWRTANRERHREYAAAWVAENRDKYRETQRRGQRRYKQRKRVGHDVVSVAYADILRCDPCSYCGGEAQAIDHIDPITRGGDSDWANLTAACHSCNSRKHNARLLEFLWRNH